MLTAADVAISTMESPAILLDTVQSPDGSSAEPNCSLASLRRRAWAKSRESTWQETQKAQISGPQEPLADCTENNEEPKRTLEEPGLAPNKITSWLDRCRTPLAGSLDEQSAPACKGVARSGYSFEDELSLGAEADRLQSINKTTGTCNLPADQKRSQYKEKGRSMNSTGSGKSSTVSSVSELLDLYEEDPEEILLNLGFGRDEPDMSSKIPSRFFNNASAARGIDIKVYLGAQLQRMEVENPNYALTSRFRQIEVLTTVANHFIQLYGHVSGNPVQNVGSSSREQGGGETSKEQQTPSLFQRSKSAQNVADRLKKSLSKHNLLPGRVAEGASAALGQVAEEAPAMQVRAPEGAAPVPAPTQDDEEQHADQHIRKKDGRALATVAEEGDKEQHVHSGPKGGGGDEAESGDLAAHGTTDDAQTLEKAPAPSTPLLAHLRTENANSFDMEEVRQLSTIQSNEDEAPASRISRSSDLLRTVSQHSDSSGFAEETSSVDAVAAAANLKVQESSDSCDSETTVTSHPSQEVATPVALSQPAFDLPDTAEDASGSGAAPRENETSQEQEDEDICQPLPMYKAHQLPKNLAADIQEEPQPEATQASHDDAQKDLPPSDGRSAIPPNLKAPSSAPSDRPPSGHPSSLSPDPLSSDDQISNWPDLKAPSSDQPSSDPPPSNLQPSDSQHSDPPPSDSPTLSHWSSDPPPSDQAFGLQAVSPSDNLFCPAPWDSPVLSALSRVKQRLSNTAPRSSRRHQRGALHLQRSSSLPSSLLSPTRVVSSVKIQLGAGRTFCGQPHYAFRYIREPDGDRAHSPSCVSTLLIESSPEPGERGAVPQHRSPRCGSPPTEWPWLTQSVPDLSSTRELFGHYRQGGTPVPGPDTLLYPSPSPRPETPASAPPVNPSPLYPTPPYPCTSLPNLSYQYANHFAFNQPPNYASPWSLPPGSPPVHQYHHASYPMAYHSLPHSPPYLGYHGYDLSHFPPPVPDYIGHRGSPFPSLSVFTGRGRAYGPHHGLGNGSHLGLGGTALNPGYGQHLGLSPASSQVLSATEMQLRRVLHDIRGTVHTLNQQRANTSTALPEASCRQALDELRQKRRSLGAFRAQMTELELSVVHQQALVYKHLSPADRLEVEQLESLRSAVRDQLLELEQQLEDKLLELTQDAGPREDMDEVSASSALRAVEPVSELLREQLLLRSELSCHERAASPVQAPPRPAVYRTSVSIIPALPPRPDRRWDQPGEDKEGAGSQGYALEAGLHHDGDVRRLIPEIDESVPQEVRREILKEVSAATGVPPHP